MSKESVKTALAIRKRSRLGVYSVFPQSICDNLSKIEHVSYASKVFIPENQYENKVFSKVLHSLRKLWIETYELDNCYEIFEKYLEFEPILFKGPRYRDHFIHQYLVFLTGLPIISKFKSVFDSKLSQIAKIKSNLIDIDKTWLLASTYHDMGYPIERFESWLKFFFIEFLKVKKNPININMSQILVERDYLSHLYTLSEFTFQVYKKVNPILEQNDLFRLMMEKFLERNHGLVSSLMLLGNCDVNFGPGSGKYSRDVFNAQVMPSAVAIALHVPSIWNASIFPQIPFERDPITFLLIYCDTVQEWGRPSFPYSIRQSPYIPIITSYEISNNKVSTTLSYDIIEEIKLPDGSRTTTFDLKKKQVSHMMDILDCSLICFEIILESKDKDYGLEEFRKTCKVN